MNLSAQQTAQDLFNQYRQSLFQIQMIDRESGNKSSIGSGFLVSEQGDIVSNYHVISDYVFYPDKYRIQFLDSQGNTGDLTLANFDVINDLSLLKIAPSSTLNAPFELAPALPEQGTSIYSLGNPHDLGMIVVPGTYNGLKNNSFYQRIHFTGSINPGMSGGPAVMSNGSVVGVNVATAGNQIGFLVPLPKIKRLLEEKNSIAREQYKEHIQKQLHASQKSLVDALMGSGWQATELGKAKVPDKMAAFISCWGGSNVSEEKRTFLSIANRCRIGENVFLNGELQTGEVEIEFEWLTSDKLNRFQFYNLLSNRIANPRPGNQASEKGVSNYRCNQDIVINQHDVTMKSVLCVRAYKDFEDIYDALFIAATNDFDRSSLISHFTLSGVSAESIRGFSNYFMDTIVWR